MTDPMTEQPEHKHLEDQTFGKKVAEKAEEAERRGEQADTGEGEVEHHAGGKA